MNNGKSRFSFFTSGRIPLLGFVILIVILGGLAFDVSRADNGDWAGDVMRMQKIFTTIHQSYVEDIDSKKMADNAIDGMLQMLDPHSNYFEKKQYEELMVQTEGKFGGLGIQISIRDKVLTVMTPIPGTPAERAGIQSGDQILKINGKSTSGITIDQAVGKLRGEPNTEVKITIRRKGDPKDLEYTITREIIKIKSVPYYGVFDNGIGYISLKQFSQEAGEEVEKAIRELLKQNIKGLVFDLRYNPGGLLPQAIDVGAKFLPKKSLVVYTRGRIPGQNQEYSATTNPVLPMDIPLIVLVNNGSASASEIVSGAIQDWDRGLIIGDTTFGKGSVQSILQVGENHLKLTTAFYYTPSGRCINKPENAIRSKMKKPDDEEDSTDVDGKVIAKPDSAKKDTLVFKTNKGRIVFGGGGIIPDTIIEQKYPAVLIQAMFLKDVFFAYATSEYPKLKAKKIKIDKSFTISDDMVKGFAAYLDSIKFNYKSYAQIVFDDFKSRAGIVDSIKDTTKKSSLDSAIMMRNKPDWTSEEQAMLKKLTGEMANILSEENKREFVKSNTDIKLYLREAFLIREFGQDNEIIYRNKLLNDDQFKSAMAILSNKAVIDRLLTPKSK
jgi:carboxyl-terminal processing protease